MKSTAAGDAVAALRAGGVIAYPTEAVFGLGCDPGNESALRRILDIKGRRSHKGFILIACRQDQLMPFLAPVESDWQRRFDEAWPGPVTFVVPAGPGISALLTGGRDSLAVRVTDHPLAGELCRQFGSALVSTSANRSGHPPCRDAQSVVAEFGGLLDCIVDSPVGQLDSPTVIVDVVSGARLR
ncbi:MAG: threonylcarbamoyl-AMP synthase [Granulosicoccus sp.]|nr:threonylcarbamoyl-AMP synthase [Granulosicoccus sp.]